MPTYITATGATLALSQSPNGWPKGTSSKETLNGGSTNDEFQGSGGDLLVGGLGDDTYHLWDKASSIVEKANEGVDTMVDHYWGAAVLPSNVENLILSSGGATSGTGNELNNIIIAGPVGATLDGRAGNDVLVGGAGADLFRVTAGNGSDAIMNFKPSSDVIQLQGYGVTSFAQLKSLATQVGSDVKFGFANGEALVVRDVSLSSLSAYDFGLPATPVAAPDGYKDLTGPGQVYSVKGWYVLNNVWNPGTLKYGSDYTVSSTSDPTNPTSGTTFNWSFPVVTDAFQTIRAYPELIFGPAPMAGAAKATDIGGVFPLQVGSLTKLTADYSVAYKGNTDGFDVSFDIWLTNKAGGDKSTITNEVMVWLHKGGVTPFGDVVGTYTAGDQTAKIYMSKGDWTYTAIVFDTDRPVGQIDIADMLKTLKGLGIVKSSEYVASVELGAEVVSGAGSLSINKLDIAAQTQSSNGALTDYFASGKGSTSSATTTTAATAVTPSEVTTNVAATTTTGPTNTSVADTPSSTSVTSDLPPADLAKLLSGSSAADSLSGGAPDDRIYGLGGADSLSGGTGDDILRGGDGRDILDGGTGLDTADYGDKTLGVKIELTPSDTVAYVGGVAEDTLRNIENLTGGAGADTLTGNGLANVILGGDGDDRLKGGLGADTLDGGAGSDTADYSDKTAAISVSLNGAADAVVKVGGLAEDILRNVENLTGGAGADSLVGDAKDNSFAGGAGDDFMRGGGGHDVLDGGAGVDTADYQDKSQSVAVSLNINNAVTVYVGGVAEDTLSNVENVNGGSAGDTLTGDTKDNTFYGYGGADSLSGGLGKDLLVGGDGADSLNGGDGADTLVGGAGADLLTGGTGVDTFRFLALSDSTPAAMDRITDYVAGEVIDLSALDANSQLAGDQAFKLVSSFSHAAGQLMLSYADGVTTVLADVNGDAVADFAFQINGKLASTSGWIL